MDLAYAAACSNGGTIQSYQGGTLSQPYKKQKQYEPPPQQPDLGRQAAYEEAIELPEEYDEEEWAQLPVVDDLEVAALAAEAAMEAVDIKESDLKRLQESSSEASDSSSEEDDDDDDDVESVSLDKYGIRSSDSNPLTVGLHVTEEGSVSLDLKIARSEADDSDRDSIAGSDIIDPKVLEEMLSRMDDDGEDARVAAREAVDPLPAVEPLNVELLPSDIFLPVGTVSAIMGDQIIVQGPKSSRAVDEGSVLCLDERKPLGRVEEVFGPVEEPLYALRYACGGTLPAEVAPGAAVVSVQRLSTYILPEAVKVKPEEVLEGEEDEFDFSDDDAETAFQRQHDARVQTSTARSQPAPVFPASGRGRAHGRRGGRVSEGGRRGFAQPQVHPSSSTEGAHAGRRGRDSYGGRRGRGWAGAHPVQPAGPIRPPSIPESPPAGGQWVWVSQASQGPAPSRPQPPPHTLRPPPLMGPPSTGHLSQCRPVQQDMFRQSPLPFRDIGRPAQYIQPRLNALPPIRPQNHRSRGFAQGPPQHQQNSQPHEWQPPPTFYPNGLP